MADAILYFVALPDERYWDQHGYNETSGSGAPQTRAQTVSDAAQ